MRWFFPAWNGDIRLDCVSADNSTSLTIIEPTAGEIDLVEVLEQIFRRKGWYRGRAPLWPRATREKRRVAGIHAPVEVVAPYLVRTLKPGKQTLVAATMRDGTVETVEGEKVEDVEKLAKKAAKEGSAGAAVRRPTPCCPNCRPGAVEPASEVLLSFLSEDEHATWARDRFIVVRGGTTAHRYVLAHRHSAIGQQIGRICYDLDAGYVLHFHDERVPPEEEVLAAKLILEHREPWLRNQATLLTPVRGGESAKWRRGFRNPFGDINDGSDSTQLTMRLAAFFKTVEQQALQSRVVQGKTEVLG